MAALTGAKILIRIVNANRPTFHVMCNACGHDDFHTPIGSRLYPGVTDACYRAERMYADHLYGISRGIKGCPIADFVHDDAEVKLNEIRARIAEVDDMTLFSGEAFDHIRNIVEYEGNA